jgi:hypothetical protein
MRETGGLTGSECACHPVIQGLQATAMRRCTPWERRVLCRPEGSALLMGHAEVSGGIMAIDCQPRADPFDSAPLLGRAAAQALSDVERVWPMASGAICILRLTTCPTQPRHPGRAAAQVVYVQQGIGPEATGAITITRALATLMRGPGPAAHTHVTLSSSLDDA